MLKVGKSLLSQNGASKLVLTSAGNLEVWCKMERLWTTNTNDHYVNSLYFKNDGNIYLLGKDNNTRWSTEINLANSKPYMMLIQDNGMLQFSTNMERFTGNLGQLDNVLVHQVYIST